MIRCVDFVTVDGLSAGRAGGWGGEFEILRSWFERASAWLLMGSNWSAVG